MKNVTLFLHTVFFWLREFVMFVPLQFSTMVQQNLHRFECTRIVAQNQSTRKKGNDIHDTCVPPNSKQISSQITGCQIRRSPNQRLASSVSASTCQQKRSPVNIVDGKQILHYSCFLLGFVKFLPSFFPSTMCCLVFGVEDAWKVSQTSKHHLVLIHSFCTCSIFGTKLI